MAAGSGGVAGARVPSRVRRQAMRLENFAAAAGVLEFMGKR
jgi:hypothetical protein